MILIANVWLIVISDETADAVCSKLLFLIVTLNDNLGLTLDYEFINKAMIHYDED